jgi:hypothetical protein
MSCASSRYNASIRGEKYLGSAENVQNVLVIVLGISTIKMPDPGEI